MTDTVRIGMIGFSEGNGHPFSFSSIINGYSDAYLAASGWQVIYDYVKRRDASEFGIDGLKVTHAWSQDNAQTEKLCRACFIPNSVPNAEDLIGNVDAVIIARDDFESHFPLAMPFLEAGLHIFVDKPLSLDIQEMRAFKPYLKTGKLMSCSAMRYARELDDVRIAISSYGKIKLIRGAVLNSWEKYGIHLLDALLPLIKSRPVSVTSLDADHISIVINMDDGLLLQLDSLGESPKTFKVDIFGAKVVSSHDMSDNFSMFRRMLWHFGRSVVTGTPALRPKDTIDVMRILIAGRIAYAEKRKVFLDEIQI